MIVNLLPPTDFTQLLGKAINLIELSKIIYNKSTALEFPCKEFQKKNTVRCTSCGSKKYYIILRGKLRCEDCKIDYRPFGGTWLDIINVGFTKWLILIRLFDPGISARRAAREADVSYPTALNASDCIRFPCHAILKSDKNQRAKLGLMRRVFWRQREGRSRTRCQKQGNCIWNSREKGKGSR